MLRYVYTVILIFSFCTGRVNAESLSVYQQWTKPIVGDIVYSHIEGYLGGNKPVQIFIAQIPLDNPRIALRPILAQNRVDRTESVVSMANRSGAVVAINGSFFDRNTKYPFPIGFLMSGGRTLYFSHANRSAFGVTKDNVPIFGFPRTRGVLYVEKNGRYFYLGGMNRRRKKNEVVVYTAEYGYTTGTNDSGREVVVADDTVTSVRYGNSAIPVNGYVISFQGAAASSYFSWMRRGDKVKLYFVIDRDWLDVQNAISGGPLLLQGGRFALQYYRNEKFHRSITARIPITAVGNTVDGRLMLVVVDGRRPGYSVGMNYIETAELMASLGCINAIGMDGGGSSTMVVDGVIVNRPSDGRSRAVSNAIGVFLK
jgi:hypothetical protein